jgi:2-polyprenyl-3-methyl-5-hydroxy-6-metoxy-1,4-benzoquinol methylase
MADYHALYKGGDPFGINPAEIVERILKYKSSGSVLDIGAGQGRNSLFLAKSGFSVEAIDSSEEGLKKTRSKAWKIILSGTILFV